MKNNSSCRNLRTIKFTRQLPQWNYQSNISINYWSVRKRLRGTHIEIIQVEVERLNVNFEKKINFIRYSDFASDCCSTEGWNVFHASTFLLFRNFTEKSMEESKLLIPEKCDFENWDRSSRETLLGSWNL